ncbi:MAG TPA: 2-phosphosulfolactate phosphatase [Bacteroidales bacterium]|nr:2-phosphosulfolactate phosphatase [Bacteroidales bacterium]HPS17503.1 2-phosphosulfolactate phosphatase [Bacteroidales bacterium]
MSENKNCRTIETCFTPVLFPHILTKENFIVIIVDILRATTAICTAFGNGAVEVIPVAKIEETKKYRGLGYKVAGERDGIVINGADFGNSPFNFTKENVNGEKIVITTTNGTQTIEIAKHCDAVVLGAFSNINVLARWLSEKNKNIVILCSGWKNKFNIEDTIFAGALIERLQLLSEYNVNCDSSIAALDLWLLAKNHVLQYVEKASHRHRLKKLGLDDVLEYCFTEDTTSVIPILENGKLVNAL